MASAISTFVRAQAEGKALPAIPQLMDPGTPIRVLDLNRGRGGNGQARISQRESKRHLGAYGGNDAIDWVMDATRYTADTVAGAEYHFQKPQPPGNRRVPGESSDPPAALAELLDQPNPYMDYVEMMELLIIDLLLVGNAYWFKWRTYDNGKPLAVYRLAPPCVEVIPKPWGIGGYEYQVPGMEKLTIQPTEVIHFKLANPHSPYYGLGLIQGAGRTGDMELALTDSQASYFENHALPSLAVESDRRVPRDIIKKIRAQLRAKLGGPRNTGELLVLEAGLKLSSVSPTAAQAGFGELSRLSRDRIFAWFRMSPKLLGIMDEAGGADKISDAERTFSTKTARPLMNKLQRKISRELTQAWDLDYRIDYEYQMPPEDQFRLVGQVAQVPGITVDELRAYARLGPHPDAEIGKMTLNLPGQDAGTGQPGQTPTRAGFPDRNLPGEAGRPPKAGNTLPFPKPGEPLPAGSAARKALDDIFDDIDRMAAEQKALRDGAPDTRVPGEARPDDSLATRRESDVDVIAADLASDLSDAARILERGLLDHVEGKAFKPSNLVQRLRGSEAWKLFRQRITAAVERAARAGLSTAAVHHGTLGLVPEDEIDYDALAKQLVHRKDGVASVTNTLKQSLVAALKDARDGGKTREELNTLIQERITTWQRDHADGIALTEVTRAYNVGTLEVAKATGSTHVAVSDGQDHDEPCKEADGQVWTIDQAAKRPLEHPRCRRAFVPIPKPQEG